MNRETRELIHDLQRHGWTVREGKHLKLIPPGGGRGVSMSRTPSDRSRALQNQLADLRRALRDSKS